MNQGCITSLFSVTSIYIAVLFYIRFKESISASKIVGILAIIPCVLLLSLDKKDESMISEDDEKPGLSVEQMKTYGLLAVLMALLGPFFWTCKGYKTRQAIENKTFPVFDLAIDATAIQAVIQTAIYVVYLTQNKFEWSLFIEG